MLCHCCEKQSYTVAKLYADLLFLALAVHNLAFACQCNPRLCFSKHCSAFAAHNAAAPCLTVVCNSFAVCASLNRCLTTLNFANAGAPKLFLCYSSQSFANAWHYITMPAHTARSYSNAALNFTLPMRNNARQSPRHSGLSNTNAGQDKASPCRRSASLTVALPLQFPTFPLHY